MDIIKQLLDLINKYENAVSATSSFIAVIISIVTLCVTGYRQNKLLKNTNRPNIICELIFDWKSKMVNNENFETYVMIQITNIGKTPALNTKFNFSPKLITNEDKNNLSTETIQKYFDQKISFLPPKRKIRIALGWFPDYYNNKELPKKYKVNIEYDSTKKPWLNKLFNKSEYSEIAVLDFDMFSKSYPDISDIQMLTHSINVFKRDLCKLYKKNSSGNLREINKNIDKLTKTINNNSAIQQ